MLVCTSFLSQHIRVAARPFGEALLVMGRSIPQMTQLSCLHLAWLRAEADMGPLEKRWEIGCSLHSSAFPPALGPLQNDAGGAHLGPWTLTTG